MTLNRKDVVSNLSRKGFKTIEKTKHTALIHQNSIGQRTGSKTIVSRGTKHKTLGNDIVASMAKGCKLSINDFRKLVDCSMSKFEYEN